MEGVGDLAASAVWGLVRSAQAEHPGRVVLVDTDAEVDAAVLAAAGEPQLLVRAGAVHAARLVLAPRLLALPPAGAGLAVVDQRWDVRGPCDPALPRGASTSAGRAGSGGGGFVRGQFPGCVGGAGNVSGPGPGAGCRRRRDSRRDWSRGRLVSPLATR